MNRGSSHDYRYWAFLSYSSTDEKWSRWIHRRIERYRIPGKVVRLTTKRGHDVPKRLRPIFRDRDELPTAASLGEAVRDALEQSRYLIVICSTRAARSRWVNQEILQFKQQGKSDRIIALIVDGVPNADFNKIEALPSEECFPDALRYRVDKNGRLDQSQPEEPIAADVRPGKDGKRRALIKLIAGIAGVDFDVLWNRHVRRRRLRIATFSIVSVIVAFGITFSVGVAFGIGLIGNVGGTAMEADETHRVLGLAIRNSEDILNLTSEYRLSAGSSSEEVISKVRGTTKTFLQTCKERGFIVNASDEELQNPE